jgi:tetratricopeptide (TPR) repeat protein
VRPLADSSIHSQLGNGRAQADLTQAQHLSDPQVQWEMMLAEGQLLENAGQFDQAAERYRCMMALKPGDHRGRLLLADLYRRSENYVQAIVEYRAIIQSKPHIGPAYVGASKAYLGNGQLDNAIKVLEDVSSRNASYNDVLIELVDLYNQRAAQGDLGCLEQAARAIDVLRQNGVDSRQSLRLIAEFYCAALAIARETHSIPALSWPDKRSFAKVSDLAKANEQAWRDYLARDVDANRDEVVNNRIMNMRTWAVL